MSTKSPECWAIDPQASGLRVEVSPDKDILLPFDQFVYGELTTEGQAHLLEMHFATHHVLVHGQNLRRIQNAMQHKELGYRGKAVNQLSRNCQTWPTDDSENRSDCGKACRQAAAIARVNFLFPVVKIVAR